MSEVVTEDRLKEIKRGFAVGLNRGDLGLHAEDVKWLISEVERLQNTQDMLTDTLDRRDATIATLRRGLEKHGVHRHPNCTYDGIISGPNMPRKPCVCGFEKLFDIAAPSQEENR